jgi:hypothetical protein
LTKTLVEVAPPFAAGNMSQDTIENEPLLFIFVEPKVEKLSQVSATLRGTKRMGIMHHARTGIALLSRVIP